ncbi:MAG: hypothetical protein ACXADW_20445 [Candidatus Hodarchaeales archaeon]|jgi:hypothetical protein
MTNDETIAPESTVETPNQPTLDEQVKERIDKCNEEIAEILQKYNCDLEANVLLRPGMVIPQIRVVPVEILQQEMQQRRAAAQQPVSPIIQP